MKVTEQNTGKVKKKINNEAQTEIRDSKPL